MIATLAGRFNGVVGTFAAAVEAVSGIRDAIFRPDDTFSRLSDATKRVRDDTFEVYGEIAAPARGALALETTSREPPAHFFCPRTLFNRLRGLRWSRREGRGSLPALRSGRGACSGAVGHCADEPSGANALSA